MLKGKRLGRRPRREVTDAIPAIECARAAADGDVVEGHVAPAGQRALSQVLAGAPAAELEPLGGAARPKGGARACLLLELKPKGPRVGRLPLEDELGLVAGAFEPPDL